MENYRGIVVQSDKTADSNCVSMCSEIPKCFAACHPFGRDELVDTDSRSGDNIHHYDRMDLLIHRHDYRLALLHQFQVACFSSMCIDYRDRRCARRIGVYVFTPRTDSCSSAILARFSCESIDHEYRAVA